MIIIILLKTAQHRPFFTFPVAACWTRILSSGLAVETKENIIKKYLPPENCQELSPPLINPKVKRASPENSVRRDARIAQVQQQEGNTTEWTQTSCSQELPEELPTNKTSSASDREAGQSERQEKSPLVLEVGTPCGRLRYFIQRWKHFSFHKKILSYINGVSIPLCDLQKQTFIPSEPQSSKKENKVILNLIKQLVKGGTICPVSPKENQFISNIFTVPKPDGSHRLICSDGLAEKNFLPCLIQISTGIKCK
nr:unnamed protein product [Callosobruchus analis]